MEFVHYFDKANRANGADNKTQARISYLRGIKTLPIKGLINQIYGKFLRDDKRYKKAEFRYRKASIMIPRRISVYTEWGIMLDRQGILEGQEELFRKVIELDPHDVEGFCNLGAVLTEKGRFEEAMVLFERPNTSKL